MIEGPPHIVPFLSLHVDSLSPVKKPHQHPFLDFSVFFSGFLSDFLIFFRFLSEICEGLICGSIWTSCCWETAPASLAKCSPRCRLYVKAKQSTLERGTLEHIGEKHPWHVYYKPGTSLLIFSFLGQVFTNAASRHPLENLHWLFLHPLHSDT